MLTDIEVKKIAKLAKLNLQKNEINIFADQLSDILALVNQLEEVDCENVEPLTSVSDMSQRLREDIVTSGDISENILANSSGDTAELAKDVKCFIVPKVVE